MCPMNEMIVNRVLTGVVETEERSQVGFRSFLDFRYPADFANIGVGLEDFCKRL
jgi:hypothetical protein